MVLKQLDANRYDVTNVLYTPLYQKKTMWTKFITWFWN